MRMQWVSAVVRDAQVLAGEGLPHSLLPHEAVRLFVQRLTPPTDIVECAILSYLMVQVLAKLEAPFAKGQDLCKELSHLSLINWSGFQRRLSTWFASSRQLVSSDAVLVRAARDYIREQIGSSISVSQLSAELHCHKRTLERAFRRTAHQSVHAVVLMLRTLEAIHLLISTDDKIDAIAFEVGIRSRTTLRVAIANATGLSPSELRRVCSSGVPPSIRHRIAALERLVSDM